MNRLARHQWDRGARILLADDDRVGRRILEGLFAARGYLVEVAADGAEAWRILEADLAPRLVIVDWSMPGVSGVEVCRRVRASVDRPYTYLLVLTAKEGTEGLVEALDAGADDFLRKPFEVDELLARVRAGQRILDLQSALLDAQENLRILATHDALTGEWNRPTILEMLEHELSRARREGTSVAVLLADIDRFKAVNDTYGHDAGDVVIRHTVARMKSSLRTTDRIGRYGGEEVLVVLPGCPIDHVGEAAERVRLSVADAPAHYRDSALPVTISVGVAASERRPDVTAASLVAEADLGLYRAKRGGRNRVEFGEGVPSALLDRSPANLQLEARSR